jgi:S-adenosylhomocysteine hydrolase
MEAGKPLLLPAIRVNDATFKNKSDNIQDQRRS